MKADSEPNDTDACDAATVNMKCEGEGCDAEFIWRSDEPTETLCPTCRPADVAS